jgi:glycosyltransferase involved in cell wall biosynthesis
MNVSDVTVLMLAFDEEPNLARALAALTWANRIVVVDSGSRDRTRAIAEAVPNTTVVSRAFDTHSNQWNFGLDQVATAWTLALDADYVCPVALGDELARLSPDADAYEAAFSYWIHGRPLRAALYPPRVVLFRSRSFRYEQDGHTQRLSTGTATVGRLRSVIAHDDRKPLGRWLDSQRKYAVLEADMLSSRPLASLSRKDRMRRGIVWAPALMPLYCLAGKGLALDGWRGVFYTLQRTYAEALLSLELLDRRLSGR